MNISPREEEGHTVSAFAQTSPTRIQVISTLGSVSKAYLRLLPYHMALLPLLFSHFFRSIQALFDQVIVVAH